jgi:hypothetical protein
VRDISYDGFCCKCNMRPCHCSSYIWVGETRHDPVALSRAMAEEMLRHGPSCPRRAAYTALCNCTATTLGNFPVFP